MRREGKDLSPRFSTGRKRRILSTLEQKKTLWKQLEENDDATLERHCELCEERTGVRVSPEGQRAYGKAPRNWGKNVTLISSITLAEGMGASMSMEGSSDTASFGL